MVRAGEETGKLDETFAFLADYMDRNYEISQKARNALIYPAFVMVTFVVVMILMMTLVVPNLASMLNEAGQEIPVYTKVVIGISTFFADYIFLIIVLIIIGSAFLVRYSRTENGRMLLSKVRLQLPYLGSVYRSYFFLVSQTISTMLKKRHTGFARHRNNRDGCRGRRYMNAFWLLLLKM